MKLLDLSQELRELGARGTLFRVQWELRNHLRLHPTIDPQAGPYANGSDPSWTHRLPLADAPSVAAAIRPRISASAFEKLLAKADEAALHGKILAFGRWTADYGRPINWRINPRSGAEWNRDASARDVVAGAATGDVKYTWEVGRFPHAYYMSRAATFAPENRNIWAGALCDQIADFQQANPSGHGIHWTSGQEVAFRLLAWLFAFDVCLSRSAHAQRASSLLATALIEGATFIEEHLDYARYAVYNNHLLSEALALFGVGALMSDAPRATHWRRVGRKLLDEEAERQFYEDGGYIQQSHNYHRVALQDLLWACLFAKSMGDRPSSSWLRAMERSLNLLVEQQNVVDGRLPNYGANDGSHPSPLSECDFSDYRPTLQAVSLLTRGARLYGPGPWDEEAAWFLGVRALDMPLVNRPRRSVSLPTSGHHVMRGNDPSSFATFRCGSLRDRFSQIDMLHVDVWWRSQNVLVDAGSYSYNGPSEWHNAFMRTAAHNTVMVDGRDQMLHFRQFKVLYWTKARLLAFRDEPRWALCSGEHYGYRRHAGAVVHRRSVLFLKDDAWIVADHISGTGDHEARLHWLCGDYPAANDGSAGVTLRTPAGQFTIRVADEHGQGVSLELVKGQEQPPRGWLSRYYGERTPVASLSATLNAPLPLTYVSILAGEPVTYSVDAGQWSVKAGNTQAAFALVEGRFDGVTLA